MPIITKRRVAVAGVLVLIVVTALFLEFYSPPVNAKLTDINSKEELQKLFNQDSGSTRIILLLSPT
jgi:hypothetical protein